MEDINLILFDRFLQVGRQMRKGSPPGAVAPCCARERRYGPADSLPEKAGPSSGPLKREMILAYLLLRKSGGKQREIAEEIGVSPSTVSAMIGRLVEDRYLVQEAVPGDRRTKLVVLTREGRSRAEQILQEVTLAFAAFFGNLEEEDKGELIRLLDKLLGNGGEPPAPPEAKD